MPKSNFILAFDLGTTGLKASVFDCNGNVIDSVASSYNTFYPKPNWAEQNPNDWWKATIKTTRGIVKRNPKIKNKIVAIGVSGHMLGCLPVDDKGRPLRNLILHSDSRAQEQWKKIEKLLGKEKIYKITGNRIDPRSSICKIQYVKEKEKDVYNKTYKFLQSKDYLTYKLTGVLGNTDYSDASHSVVLDINKKQWSDVLLSATGIDKNKLPALRSSSDIIGYLKKDVANEMNIISGIPVIVGGGDGACATVGAGAVEKGETYNYIGGTAWISSIVEKPFIDKKMRVFNILGLDPNKCGVFGTVQSGGSSYQWLSEILALGKHQNFELMNKLADKVNIGSNKLFFLPYLMGERSPLWDPYAKGVFFGLTLSHKRPEIIRAVLEGVSFALNSVLEVLEEAINIKELRLIGGGANSELWRNILTNVYGKKLMIPKMKAEATSYGAAIAAGVGVGLYNDYKSAVKMIKIEKEYFPDKIKIEEYLKFFKFYKSLYPALKDSFSSLSNFTIRVK